MLELNHYGIESLMTSLLFNFCFQFYFLTILSKFYIKSRQIYFPILIFMRRTKFLNISTTDWEGNYKKFQQK